MGKWEDYCQAFTGNRECETKVTKRSHGGGRRFQSPIEINTLSDIESLYEEENPMNEIVIGNEDVVRFRSGREATGGELSKRAAGERLVGFAKRHVAKNGGTMAEALKVAYRLNPEWVRTYLGLRRSE